LTVAQEKGTGRITLEESKLRMWRARTDMGPDDKEDSKREHNSIRTGCSKDEILPP
jgi:hypothetical protein